MAHPPQRMHALLQPFFAVQQCHSNITETKLTTASSNLLLAQAHQHFCSDVICLNFDTSLCILASCTLPMSSTRHPYQLATSPCVHVTVSMLLCMCTVCISQCAYTVSPITNYLVSAHDRDHQPQEEEEEFYKLPLP